jgi:hypothetical protein
MMKRFPCPPFDYRPSLILFLNKRGAPSVIYFSNYFLEGEFCHFKTQQGYLNTKELTQVTAGCRPPRKGCTLAMPRGILWRVRRTGKVKDA